MLRSSILFVDDDVLTHWIMSDVLQEAGYQVVSACRATEAARQVRSAPEFDLLLLDLDLPDRLTSPDLGQLWRRYLPRRPIVYTGSLASGAARPLEVWESFLPKPYTPTALLQALDLAHHQAQFAAMHGGGACEIPLLH